MSYLVNNMFSTAYELASQYTDPVITFAKAFNGEVYCSGCAFVILNEEGWIITVAHLWDFFKKFVDDEPHIHKYNQEINRIKQNKVLNENEKRMKIKKIKNNSTWLTNCAFWWGMDGRELVDVIALEEVDLAAGRLEPFDPKTLKHYPAIKNPNNIKIGTSLCKLGFPFSNITATYDTKTNNFQIDDGVLPMPFFPMDGIYTRDIIDGNSQDGKYEIKFLETSSPGLPGQSGGPIFDSSGVLWSIQSRTNFLDLGFCPTVVKNGKQVEENQFLNVGVGVHPEVIVQFLSENGVNFNISD